MEAGSWRLDLVLEIPVTTLLTLDAFAGFV
jgi:hypothetical protein